VIDRLSKNIAFTQGLLAGLVLLAAVAAITQKGEPLETWETQDVSAASIQVDY